MKNLEGDSINLKVPLNKNYAPVLRLAVSSIASRMDFTWDKVEDLKMALEEVFLLVYKSNGNEEINLDFKIFTDRLEILVKKAAIKSFANSIEQKYSFFIMTGLLDKVDIQPKDKNKFNILMVKNLW